MYGVVGWRRRSSNYRASLNDRKRCAAPEEQSAAQGQLLNASRSWSELLRHDAPGEAAEQRAAVLETPGKGPAGQVSRDDRHSFSCRSRSGEECPLSMLWPAS